METTITPVNEVEYDLNITATAEDLAPEIDKLLRQQRSRATMKGFRTGKVPLQLVKKMYGKAIAYEYAERTVQSTYEERILDSGDYEVLGQPVLTKLDYELDGDLDATIRFGVRPDVELVDLSGESLDKLVKDITDEDVEKELEALRERHADLVPVEDEPVAEDHLVVFDVQELDPETQTPIIGKRDEDRSLILNAEAIEQSPFLQALRDALLGANIDDRVRFQFAHDEAHGDHPAGETHAHHFEATVKEIKRRELPELDDAFAAEVSDDQFIDLDELRAEIRKEMEQAWAKRGREFLEGAIVSRMIELHPVPVPASITDMYLTSYVKDVEQRNEGKLPEGFDEAAFREANREDAEKQARWMLIRDKIIETENISMNDEDLDAFFDEQASGDDRISAEQMKQFYRSMPQLMEQVEHRLISQKIFALLEERFDVTEKDPETMEREAEERQAAAAE